MFFANQNGRFRLLASLIIVSGSLLLLTLTSPSPLFTAAHGEQSKPATLPPAAALEHPVPVPEPSPLALQRNRSGNWLWVVNRTWGLLIPAVFLVTGLSARLRTWATRIGCCWFACLALYVALFVLLYYLLSWPLAFYQGYVREHAYGLSNQTLQKWFQDSLISLALVIVMGVLSLWVPYLLIRKSPRRWWLYTGLSFPPFACFQVLILPVFIDPLFNEFGPMRDKELEGKILALAQQCGIDGSRVFEVNKSVDTKAVNAYVTGFWNTKRIVLWDTLLAKLDDDEVLFVVGHEMGHYVLHHITQDILLSSFALLIALYLVHRLASALLARQHGRFGFDSLADMASLPLLLLLLNLINFLATPLILGVSRYQEHEADRFAIELTQLNHAAATGFVKLQQENLAVPWHSLLYKIWRDSHPPVGERITFFNSYKPWKVGPTER